MPIIVAPNGWHLFVHIPKTGGSSIESALQAHCPVTFILKNSIDGLRVSPQHFHYKILKESLEFDLFESRFGIVRHPVDRFVSAYHWRIKSRGAQAPFEEWAWGTLERLRSDPYLFGNHLRRQVEYVGPEIDIYRFEDGLNTALSQITRKMALTMDVELPWCKRTSNAPMRLSRQLLQKLFDYYGPDFERFGYERNSGKHEVNTKNIGFGTKARIASLLVKERLRKRVRQTLKRLER